MIRSFVLANSIALGNRFCGSGAVLAAMQFLVSANDFGLVLAMALPLIALASDFTDGRIARWRHHSFALGADLDSRADVIAVGLAPAALGFAVGLRGALDVALRLYFIAGGISRLARFNVTFDALSDDSDAKSSNAPIPLPQIPTPPSAFSASALHPGLVLPHRFDATCRPWRAVEKIPHAPARRG